ncbi:hypothetical protein MED222_05930 [Vibrio sp. MED222]|nr:hypothetical protein MED222_05930 [Vibrio sp. MED222]
MQAPTMQFRSFRYQGTNIHCFYLLLLLRKELNRRTYN